MLDKLRKHLLVLVFLHLVGEIPLDGEALDLAFLYPLLPDSFVIYLDGYHPRTYRDVQPVEGGLILLFVLYHPRLYHSEAVDGVFVFEGVVGLVAVLQIELRRPPYRGL